MPHPHAHVADLLSPATRQEVDRLVDVMVGIEHGTADVYDTELAWLHTSALIRLRHDFLAVGQPTDREWPYDYARTVLRSLVEDALVGRQCQCKLLFPQGCPHGTTVDARWCGEHVASKAAELYGARLCPSCHAHVLVS